MGPRAGFLIGVQLPLPKRYREHGKRKREATCGADRLFPRRAKPATVLTAVKDKPFGWPPSGGHP